jgi:hypothetical protein
MMEWKITQSGICMDGAEPFEDATPVWELLDIKIASGSPSPVR